MIGEQRSLGFAFNIAAGISCLAIPIFIAASRKLTRGTPVADIATHAGT
jgi:hypothetical protein